MTTPLDLSITENRDHAAGISTKRSDKWPALEHKFLSEHPTCAACGSSIKLQAHHCHPFHLDPALELDPNNLIALCMDPKFECHLKIGHGDDFRAYNPNVVVDAATVKTNISMLTEVAVSAKTNRLLG